MEAISRLVTRLNRQGIDAALISDPNAIRYFTGTRFSPGERLLALLVKKDGSCRLCKSAYLFYNAVVLVISRNHLTLYAKPCADEAELPVTVSGLVKVHEVHINAFVGQPFVVLCVQMKHRLAERLERTYPHFRRRKGVHPHYNADTFPVRRSLCADRKRLAAVPYNRLKNNICNFAKLFVKEISHFI